jgi:hypothetical protein
VHLILCRGLCLIIYEIESKWSSEGEPFLSSPIFNNLSLANLKPHIHTTLTGSGAVCTDQGLFLRFCVSAQEGTCSFLRTLFREMRKCANFSVDRIQRFRV